MSSATRPVQSNGNDAKPAQQLFRAARNMHDGVRRERDLGTLRDCLRRLQRRATVNQDAPAHDQITRASPCRNQAARNKHLIEARALRRDHRFQNVCQVSFALFAGFLPQVGRDTPI